MKKPFEVIVEENTGWLLQYVKSKIPNRSLAEDFVQEIFLRAYRAYPSYVDTGYTKAWLKRIAQNHINNYYRRDSYSFLSLDYADEEDDSLYSVLTDGTSPEEKILEHELTREVMSVIMNLPQEQKDVLVMRYLNDMSVEATAEAMNIPAGSVKSKTHYAIKAVREKMGIETKNIKPKKEKNKMKCTEAYKYLFVYAMGKLNEEKKAEVEAHLKECETCRNIADALVNLYPQMKFAKEDERSHYLISFPERGLIYSGGSKIVNDYEQWNKNLEKWNNIIPDNVNFSSSGFTGATRNYSSFDDYGNELEIEQEYDESEETTRVTIKKLYHVEKNTFIHDVSIFDISLNTNVEDPTLPGLYRGERRNFFGQDVKSALYVAVPKAATNIRIKRGNGVIDGGTYFFPYVDRYVTKDEGIYLEYTFNMIK